MTLVATELYDDWIDVFTNAGLNEQTAVDLTETILADPRVINAAPKGTEETQELIERLDTLLMEAKLGQFDNVTNAESLRGDLRGVTEKRLDISNEDPDNTPSDSEPTATVDISEIDDGRRNVTGSGMSGMVSGMSGNDTQPEGNSLAGGGPSGDGPPEQDRKNATESSDGTDSDVADDGDEGDTEEEYSLETILAVQVLQIRQDTLDEQLEVDITEDIRAALVQYATQTVQTYEATLREELFPNHPEHEAKVLYEQLVRDSVWTIMRGGADETSPSEETDEETRDTEGQTNDGSKRDAEDEETETQRLVTVVARQRFKTDIEAIDSALDVPVEPMSHAFVTFGVEVAEQYRRLVADALFAGVPEQHRGRLQRMHLEAPVLERVEAD